jgi:hypothetical protein
MKLRQGREDKREAELSELKTQHQDLMHVRKSMIADRDRLAAEVAAEMGRAAQAQQRLHAELDAAHSMRDELQRQAAELREELKEKSEALASANAQVQDKISEVAALAGSLQEQQMLKDRADSESKSALEALAKECAVAAAASKALESDKKELMWKTQAQEDKVADLKTLLAGLQLQLEERRKDLDKCEGEKQEARLEAARLKAERDLQEGKLEETRAKLDAKEEQIKDAMKTVQQVQNMSLERSKEVAKERESQEREREALTRDMLQGKDDLVQAHRELDSLKKSLADLEAKGCSADDALGKSKVEVESLQAKVAELSSKLDKVVNTVFTILELRNNSIGDEGAAQVAAAMHVNTVLTDLDLAENSIGDEGLLRQVEAACDANHARGRRKAEDGSGEEVDESEGEGCRSPEGSDFAAEEGYEEGDPNAEEGHEKVWGEVKQILGERLYALIQVEQGSLAGKITGMLLEGLDNSELVALIDDQVALQSKIQEALAALEAHQPAQAAGHPERPQGFGHLSL